MQEQKEVTLEDAFNMALGHMQQSNYRVAEMILKDILKAQPDHSDSYYMLALAQYYMGNLGMALETIQGALKDENPEAEWWCNYGIMLNETKRYEEAIEAYDRAIEIDPDYPNSYWNKSHALWLQDRFEEAEKAARKGIEIDGSSAEAWLNLGTAVVKLGRLEEAAECWEKALSINPDFAFAWNNLGNVLRDMGKLEASEEKCRKALEIDPNYAQAMNNLGNALLDLGQVEEAEEWYRKAIAQQPDYAEAHNNLCISMIRQHRYEEAIVSARYAISFKPDYADALINLSHAYRSIGRMEEAEKAIQKASVLQPDSAEVHIDLADILFMQDRYGDAEIELQKAREMKPDSSRVYLKLSNVLERGNKVEEALEAIDKAIELNPEMPETYLRKGNICHISNRVEEAKTYFEKTLEMREDMPAALISLAELYQSLGDMDASREYIDRVHKIAPDTPALYHTLGKTKKFKEDDPEFQKMVELEKTVERYGLDQAAVLNFALFSAYQDIGDDRKAFEHLKKGNDYKRKTIPYDRQQQAENYERIKQSYTPENLKTLEGKGCPSDIPVFIVGMPRSGTTLTEQLISSHPDVFGAGELMELSMTDAEYGPLNEQNAAKKGKWYVEQVKKRDVTGKATRITDKMPGNFSSLGKIVSILPHAKIIHCRRNPIDTCLSCYKQNFARGQYWSYNLEELADYYNDYLNLMSYWREVLPDKFIEIDYEDTVNTLEDQARKLIEYVDLPWDDACLEPHKQKRAVLTASKTQVIKPVYKTSVKAWARYEEELQPLIDRLMKGPAKELLESV
ncbi:MAG: tetratricopeptide repeat protein [Rhodospirillales bacterium]|nr:tetratricopeptide repeat protein [Alphaproteobacteria bacterium]USO03979.1 MAG: tetratricopeptide repeat protein [Rhodospirillales bacterium]